MVLMFCRLDILTLTLCIIAIIKIFYVNKKFLLRRDALSFNSQLELCTGFKNLSDCENNFHGLGIAHYDVWHENSD